MAITRSRLGMAGLALLLVLAHGTRVPGAEGPGDWSQKALNLNKISGDSATDGEIKALKNDPASTRKLLAAAAELAKDRKKQPFNLNATYILASAAQDLKLVDIGQTFYEIQIEQATALGSAQKIAVAYLGLIELLIDNGKVEASQKVFQKFVEVEDDNDKSDLPTLKLRVERIMILSMAQKGKLDEALKLIDKKLEANPKNWSVVNFKATVYRVAGKLELAVKTYEGLIESLKDDEKLKDKEEIRTELINEVRYSLSSVYIDLKLVEKAAAELKDLLAKDPDNPTYNNDLGYIWADNGMHLEESEKMIRKAIEDDRKERQERLKKEPEDAPVEIKDNPSFLDSLGWVLFKQKKYKEARPYLVKAVEDRLGQNIEIYDHLGEVHMALGDKAAALEAWKKGLEVAGTTPRDVKRKVLVEKKVKDNEK